MVKTRSRLRMPTKRVIALLSATALLILCLATPNLLCRTGLATQILQKTLSTDDVNIRVGSVDLGWTTTTIIENLSITTDADDRLSIASVTCDLSILEWLTLGDQESIEVYARKVALDSKIAKGEIRFLSDLQQTQPSNENRTKYLVDLKEISLLLEDQDHDETWQLNQANAIIAQSDQGVTINLDGVVTDPNKRNGSLRCSVSYTDPESRNTSETATEAATWNVDLNIDSLPVSCSRLIGKYLNSSELQSAGNSEGDLTGELRIDSNGNQETKISFSKLQLRKFRIKDAMQREWRQQLSEINGEITTDGEAFITNDLWISTDFGHISVDGEIRPTDSIQSLVTSLDNISGALKGSVEIDIDVPTFWQSASILLPVKQDTEIISGRMYGEVQSGNPTAPMETTLNIVLEDFTAMTESGESISLAPNSLRATIERGDEYIRANQVEWRSEFGSAYFEGDLRDGSGVFDIDFNKITTSLNQILKLEEDSFSGTSNGRISWSAAGTDQWTLSGSFNADEVTVRLGLIGEVKQNKIHGKIDASGIWGDEGLEKIQSLNASLDFDDTMLSCQLLPSAVSENHDQRLGLHWSCRGPLSTFDPLSRHWSNQLLRKMQGNYVLEADSFISNSEIAITQSTTAISNFSSDFDQISLKQPLVKLALAGSYDFSTHDWRVRDFTLSSRSISARAQGNKSGDLTEYEVQWRTLLDKLSSSFSQRTEDMQNEKQSDQLLNSLQQLQLSGDGEGTFIAKHSADRSQYEIDTRVSNLSIPHLTKKSADSSQGIAGGEPRISYADIEPNRWLEPNTRILAVLHAPRQHNEIVVDQLEVSTDWIQTSLNGKLTSSANGQSLSLQGNSEWNMDRLNHRIASMLPLEVSIRGMHESEVMLSGLMVNDKLKEFDLSTTVGWDSAELAGIPIATASIPISVKPNAIHFHDSRLPVGNGWVNLSGSLRQLNQDTWIELNPSQVVKGIEITPKLSKQWLRFIAPILADATEINGTVGISLDEAKINLNDAAKTQLSGRLELDTVRLIAGPFTNQLIQTLQQIKTLGTDQSDRQNTDPSTLLQLPKQITSFAVANQVVAHERLLIDIDRAQLITTGQVSFNGQVNLTTAIPLDAKWLGRDLQFLAGQTLYLPIQGSLTSPTLDKANLQKIISQIGMQTIQQNAESFIEDQINRGLDKLFGK